MEAYAAPKFSRRSAVLPALLEIVLLLSAQRAAAQSLATERAVAGTMQAAKGAAQWTTDTLPLVKDVLKAGTQIGPQTELASSIANYQAERDRHALKVQGVKAVSGIVQTGATLYGGPVGLAVSGVASIALDNLVVRHYAKLDEQSRDVFHAAAGELGPQALDEFFLKPEANSQKLLHVIDEYLEGEGLKDEKDREFLKTQAHRIGLGLAVDNAKQARAGIEAAKKAGAEARNAAKQAGKTLGELRQFREQFSSAAKNIQQGLDEVRFRDMSWKERSEFMEAGGLPLVTGDDRKQLQLDVSRQASLEKLQRGMATAMAATEGLAVVAEKVLGDPHAAKALRKVSQGLQIGMSVFNTYSAFATTGPLAGLGAIGSLGSSFGGGSIGGLGRELAAIQAALAAMDRKLDKVLELQRDTLGLLQEVAADVTYLRLSVDEVRDAVATASHNAVVNDYTGYFLDCRGRLLPSWPVRQPVTSYQRIDQGELIPWQEFHFMNRERLSLLRGSDGVADRCFSSMSTLAGLPQNFAQLAPPGRRAYELAELVKSDKLRFEQAVLHFKTWAGSSKKLTPRRASLSLVLATAAPGTIWESQLAAADHAKADAPALVVPCWWQKQSKDCVQRWSSPLPDTDLFDLLENKRLEPTEVLRFAEYVLRFYPQRLMPNLPAGSGALDPKWMKDQMASRVSNQPGKDAIRLIEETTRLVDIAIAQQAVLEGALWVDDLADKLLAEPDPMECAKDSKLNERFRGARVGLRLERFPEAARNAVLLAVRKRVFPSPPFSGFGDGQSDYAARHALPPSGWGASPKPNAHDDKERQIASRHFPEIAMTTPGALNHLRLIFVHPAETSFEVQYVAEVKGPGNEVCEFTDNGSTTSRKRFITLEKKTIEFARSGWHIVVGGIVMPLPGLDELQVVPYERSPLLSALVKRRSDLIDERMSFSRNEPPQVRRLAEHALRRMATSVLGKQ